MKSFKEYINELESLTDYNYKSNIVKADNSADHLGNSFLKGYHKISETPSGHHIMKKELKDFGETHYAAYNPKEDKVDMYVYGDKTVHKNGSSTLSNLNLSGRSGSTLKAHEFYHHLITNHDLILHANSQSEGGRKTWTKLSKMPGINIHGIHHAKDNDKAFNIDPSKKFLYYKSTSDLGKLRTTNGKAYKKASKTLYNISMVAHKQEPSDLNVN